MKTRIGLYFNTLRHLKFRQVCYQVFYRAKRILSKRPLSIIDHLSISRQNLTLVQSIASPQSYFGDYTFVFLNTKKSFNQKIDWNFDGFEKLWVYNLNYFDFLHQEKIAEEDCLKLIQSYCEDESVQKEGIEPYPISLRGINWIKFFSYCNIRNPRYDALLYSHYLFLSSNLEYHLLGNHLLENGFSLLFGSYYFNHKTFYRKAERLLVNELNEQILPDGGHFERSPMYHQTLLYRLLDCINLLKNNRGDHQGDKLFQVLNVSASRMLGWLQEITFSNGEVPMVNDAVRGLSFSTSELVNYATRLGVAVQPVALSGSGYRMIRMRQMELFIDVGDIGPDYIPGHAHSDTFNFILYVKGHPLIVETGTSTYTKGIRRLLERSTISHNTVVVDGRNQSEVWASFRVGKRAKVTDLVVKPDSISATHNGYEGIGIVHRRTWKWTGDEVWIMDELAGATSKTTAIASIHFYPGEMVVIKGNEVYAGSFKILISKHNKLELEEYAYANGYNQTVVAQVLRIHFTKSLAIHLEG